MKPFLLSWILSGELNKQKYIALGRLRQSEQTKPTQGPDGLKLLRIRNTFNTELYLQFLVVKR